MAKYIVSVSNNNHYMVEDVCLSVCPKLLFVTFLDNLKNAVHSEWEQRAERHYSSRHER